MHIIQIGYNSIHDRGYRADYPDGTQGYMLIVLKTPAVFELYGEKNLAESNSIVIYDKKTPHCYSAVGDIFINDWIHFDTDYDADFFKSLNLPLNSIIRFGDVDFISSIIRNLCSEFYSVNPKRNEMLDCLLKAMLIKAVWITTPDILKEELKRRSAMLMKYGIMFFPYARNILSSLR